jgi:hypothetical protein
MDVCLGGYGCRHYETLSEGVRGVVLWIVLLPVFKTSVDNLERRHTQTYSLKHVRKARSSAGFGHVRTPMNSRKH